MRNAPLLRSSADTESGFTLIELAIVVVIVGLLLGGILAGGSLLDASENRRVFQDAESYITAIGQFRDKYGSLPGDMFDAETIWGQAGAAAACKTATTTVKATCNGDGNGQIALGVTTGIGGAETVEHLRAWQQLVSGGFVTGNLNGIPGSGGDDHSLPRENVPEGVFDGSGYSLYYRGVGDAAGMGNFFGVNATEVYGHILHFGQPTATSVTSAPAMLPESAEWVDAKMDDGKPYSGSVRTYQSTAQPNCATADDATAEYDLSYEDGFSCNLIFLTGF